MKKLSVFIIVCATIILASCNGISQEKWLETTVCTMYEGNVTSEIGPV